LDKIRVEAEVVGRYTARVALMEVMSVCAMPFLVACTLPVEPCPTAAEIARGVRNELKRAKLAGRVAMMLSTEKNFPVSQTAVGITVLAVVSRRMLRTRRSRRGDALVAVGLPFVGFDVIKGEKEGKVVDLTDLTAILRSNAVHDVIPVGSGGIMKEAKVIAKDSGLGLRLCCPDGISLSRSAGPATVILCSASESKHTAISALTHKPVTRIGTLR